MRNRFATKGRKLHRLIVPKTNMLDYMFEPNKVLEVLDKIRIPEDKALRCHLVDRFHHCIGDNSFLYVNDIDALQDENRHSYLEQTWENIIVEPSDMGMWQTYLLMSTIHVMPYYWHGGYYKRVFIFSPSDLKRISELKGKDLSHIKEEDLQPDVKFNVWLDNEYMGMVSCTYWSEWEGLVRETVIITMYGDKITDYGPGLNDVLYSYNSEKCY